MNEEEDDDLDEDLEDDEDFDEDDDEEDGPHPCAGCGGESKELLDEGGECVAHFCLLCGIAAFEALRLRLTQTLFVEYEVYVRTEIHPSLHEPDECKLGGPYVSRRFAHRRAREERAKRSKPKDAHKKVYVKKIIRRKDLF